MRLYHEMEAVRSGSLDRRDEEECYTSVGRRCGVWLTDQRLEGDMVVSADVAADDVTAFEVTRDGDAFRTFVVPALALGAYAFVAGGSLPA